VGVLLLVVTICTAGETTPEETRTYGIGMPRDLETMELMSAEFQRLGLEIERAPFTIPSDWTPKSWEASYSVGEKTVRFLSVFPVGKTAPTPMGFSRAQ